MAVTFTKEWGFYKNNVTSKRWTPRIGINELIKNSDIKLKIKIVK